MNYKQIKENWDKFRERERKHKNSVNEFFDLERDQIIRDMYMKKPNIRSLNAMQKLADQLNRDSMQLKFILDKVSKEIEKYQISERRVVIKYFMDELSSNRRNSYTVQKWHKEEQEKIKKEEKEKKEEEKTKKEQEKKKEAEEKKKTGKSPTINDYIAIARALSEAYKDNSKQLILELLNGILKNIRTKISERFEIIKRMKELGKYKDALEGDSKVRYIKSHERLILNKLYKDFIDVAVDSYAPDSVADKMATLAKLGRKGEIGEIVKTNFIDALATLQRFSERRGLDKEGVGRLFLRFSNKFRPGKGDEQQDFTKFQRENYMKFLNLAEKKAKETEPNN